MNERTMELMNRAAQEISKAIGKDVEVNEINKMGIMKPAITVKLSGSLGINIYPSIDKLESDFEAHIQELSEVIRHELQNCPDFDPHTITDPDYFFMHLKAGLAPSGKLSQFVTRPTIYEGIDEFLYLDVEINGMGGSIKVASQLIETIYQQSINDELIADVFMDAEKRTFEDIKIKTIGDMLPGLVPDCDESRSMFVVSNESGCYGAIAILSPQVKERFGNYKCIFIPSSIHEAMIVPYPENGDLEFVTQMVKDVNATQVAPEEQLSDRAYEFIA